MDNTVYIAQMNASDSEASTSGGSDDWIVTVSVLGALLIMYCVFRAIGCLCNDDEKAANWRERMSRSSGSPRNDVQITERRSAPFEPHGFV